MSKKRTLFMIAAIALLSYLVWQGIVLIEASSHREAPLIANDPQADPTDLYAFRSPDNPNTITIIANFIPLQLPEGGPNYSSFGENIRYEIHIVNSTETTGEDIIYRFTFDEENEDPTTFFNIRLGLQNLKKTYTAERTIDGGATWETIVTGGVVPPPNIGPRSIESGVGLSTTYDALMNNAITTVSTGETIYCGPADDPFFVDLGGIFDLGQTRKFGDGGVDEPRDGVAGYNISTIALQIPIEILQKDGKTIDMAVDILDPDFVIGVWSTCSRPQIKTLNTDGSKPTYSGDWVQVARIGNPLVNEVIIPVGMKDRWNALTPYDDLEFAANFTNPELALYMDDDLFGGAVPAFSALRIQTASLGAFDFTNGANGLFGLPDDALVGTALHSSSFGPVLLQEGNPRSVDILPIFYTGVPNLRPYQLATGKGGDPLAAGKPFINNFLPTLGDMLRLNMAVPATPRDSGDFSSLGLIQAAVLGLTDSRFNTTADLEFIPNMDGFPNGRRLEDDVTRIELQAVAGVVLAAIGLWYDDYDPATSPSPVTDDLVAVLTYHAGPQQNDLPFKDSFPYVAAPHRGYDYIKQLSAEDPTTTGISASGLGYSIPKAFFLEQNYPNPFNPSTEIQYHVSKENEIQLNIFNSLGQLVDTLVDERQTPGTYTVAWNARNMPSGTYYFRLKVGNEVVPAKKALLLK